MKLTNLDYAIQKAEQTDIFDHCDILGFVLNLPEIDPIHATGNCYCKECTYYKPIRDYPDCSKILQYGYCYYWNYEEGESPNEVEEKDFCSRGVPKNV